MFTGLIRQHGELAARDGVRLRIACPKLRASLMFGDSVSVNGVCLTAEALTPDGFEASLLPETLAVTTLGSLPLHSQLNLEPALRAGDAMGGHWLQGHVDGTTAVQSVVQTRGQGGPAELATWRIGFELPGWLRPWLVSKGSVAIDGVSLTVQEITPAAFFVAIIPETWRETNLGNIMPGRQVNVEADLLVKVASQTVEAVLDRLGLTAQKKNENA